MLKSILIAVDGSEHANNAVATGCDLALKYEAKMHLVHVPQLELIAMAVGVTPAVLPYPEQDIEKEGAKVIDAAAELAKKQGCEVASLHVAQGDPAQVIHDRAKEVNADLLITGRRGLGTIGSLLLGSVSQKLSQISPCAHMTVL